MPMKPHTIELDEATAELLKARAAARGLSISELLADLIDAQDIMPAHLVAMRKGGEGPWAPDVLAEDARRLAAYQQARQAVPWNDVKAWIQSWGTPDEQPAPKPHKQ